MPDKIVCSGVSHIGISDHSLVYAFRKLSTGLSRKGHSTVSYRNFKNFNSSSFRNDICQQNWDIIMNFDNPFQGILYLSDFIIKVRTKQNRDYEPNSLRGMIASFEIHL